MGFSVMPDDTLPLAGIKIIEFSHLVMGPVTGVILADLGATVTKVEPIGGDKTRNLTGSGAGYFPMYNRNKRSICIDLKSDDGRDVAYRLLQDADVLIENFRSGAMAKLGFAYETLRSMNPGLIYCSLKGFLSGPYENRTALDELAQMMGGLAYMTGFPGRPMRAGSSIIDITGGMFGVIAILSAIEQRNRTGEGQQVTSSLFETTVFVVGQHMAQQGVLGEPPPPMSVRNSAWSVYDIFESRDGEQLFVGIVSDTGWQQFCEEFELRELAADPELATNNARVLQRDKIIAEIAGMFLGMDKDEMIRRLEKSGIPFAPINRPADLFDDPHLNANNGLLKLALPHSETGNDHVRVPALPVEMNGCRFGLYRELPGPGQDTIEVLSDAGYANSEIQSLLSTGLVKSASVISKPRVSSVDLLDERQ